METKKTTAFSLSPGILAELDRLAEAKGISRSLLVERMLTFAIREQAALLEDLEHDPFERALLRALNKPAIAKLVNRVAGMNRSPEELEQHIQSVSSMVDAAEKTSKAKKSTPKPKVKHP